MTYASRALTWKLFGALIAVLAVVAGAAITILQREQVATLRGHHRGEARKEANHLASRLAAAWAAGAPFPATAASALLDDLGAFGAAGRRTVVAADGKVLAGPPPVGEAGEETGVSASAAVSPAWADAAAPPATAHVWHDLAGPLEGMQRELWTKIVVAVASLVTALLCLYLVVDRLVLLPLERLHEPLTRMAAGGAYEPVEPSGWREIADVTAHVNRVVATLMEREAENRAAAATLDHVRRNVPDVVYRFDVAAGRFTFLSDSIRGVCGRGPEELTGDVREVGALLIHPEDLERVRKEREEHVAKGPGHGGFVREYRVLRKDGAVRHVEDHMTPEFAADGTLSALSGVMRDVTLQKEMEARLLQAQKMEAVGTLAGGIAHDFNNILSVVVGHAEMAASLAHDAERVRASLKAIVEAGTRASELTSRLLGFARKRPAHAEPTDVGAVLSRVVALLSRTFDRAIRIRTDVAPDLRPVLADPAQVEHAVLNLCLNARDAMPEGGTLTLSARSFGEPPPLAGAAPTSPPRPFVRITVSDTGTGIAPEVRARLFEPFFTTKSRGRGTGLGLAMVYGVVRGHGGWVDVETEVGRGSSFHLHLPVAPDGTPLPEPRSPPTGEDSGRGTETVLVVDDDEAVREVLVAALVRHGYRVLSAEDGPAGLAVLGREPTVALVVLDMILPGMNGLEVLKRVKALRPNLPVLLSTGYSEGGDADKALAEGCAGVLRKPYLPGELARQVRRAIDAATRAGA